MQWLCNHEDQNMQRMAVAIISILAAKVQNLNFDMISQIVFLNSLKNADYSFVYLQLSTEQTAQLGAELFIVRVCQMPS